MKLPLHTEAEKAAECAVVGAVLNHPARITGLDLEPWHFVSPRWARAWSAIRRLTDLGDHVDETTVARQLELEGVPDMLADLASATLHAAAHVERHAEIIREGYVTRQVVFAAAKVLEAQGAGISGEQLLSLAFEQLSGITVDQPDAAIPIGDLVTARYRTLLELADARAKGRPAITGVPTGIKALDKLLGGLQRGICTVAAGRPGMGKSALAMTCTANAAAAGLGVHVFSFEDTRDAYTDRTLARECGVSADQMRGGELTAPELGKIAYGVDRVRPLRSWLVDDRSGLTAEEVVRAVRRAMRRNHTQLVVVDYVQLVHGPRGAKKHEQIAHVMDVFSDAAKRDGLAYLVLAQLNRGCESRENKRPLLSDLKDSGSLEERAKAVVMLYRPSVYREVNSATNQPYPDSEIELLVRKNNHGRTGKVIGTWDGPTTRIS